MDSKTPPVFPVTLAFDRLFGYERACFLNVAAAFVFRRRRVVNEPVEPLARVPQRAAIRCHLREDSGETVVGEVEEGAFLIVAETGGNARFELAATTAETADALMDELVGHSSTRPADRVDVKLWRHCDGHTTSWTRTLTVPSWGQIRRNYPARTAAELNNLMRAGQIGKTGGLILLTGPPGTGKTSAIRALLRSWQGGTNAHLVPDPERFFGDSSYLIDVIAAGHSKPVMRNLQDGTQVVESNLVVCEDADDFIRRDNRRVAGSGVGRLLNLADGLLGQGLRTAVLLTSNTPIAELDPALSRPGRCLAQIEFEKFDLAQARSWLGDPAASVPSGGLTLAELYQRAGEITKLQTTAPDEPMIGAYL